MADLRMPELNKVFVVGRLTHDPEMKYLPSGTPLCKMRLAVSRYYKDQSGQKQEETLFINATAWDKQAEFCGEYLRKGRAVLIEGRLRSDQWEDKSTGQKRSSIEIRLERIQQLEWDGSGPRGAAASSPGAATRPEEEAPPEDDIPF